MELTQITHYAKNDPNCISDYLTIELLDEAGNTILSFKDAFHENGNDTIKGFIMGIVYATGIDVKLNKQNIADGPEQIW